MPWRAASLQAHIPCKACLLWVLLCTSADRGAVATFLVASGNHFWLPPHHDRLPGWKLHRQRSTVGAGLPVIAALQRVVAAADPVTLIAGSFSGTLGYVMSGLQAGEVRAQ